MTQITKKFLMTLDKTLPNNIKDDMKNVLNKTKDKELGFELCLNKKNGEIRRTKTSEGTKYSHQSQECGNSEIQFGRFHTHPSTTHEPSFGDLRNIMIQGFGCVGGTTDKKIKCYTRKNYNKELIDSLHHTHENELTINKTIHDKVTNLTTHFNKEKYREYLSIKVMYENLRKKKTQIIKDNFKTFEIE